MKSTTIRFADNLYRQLEVASSTTGLPVNSIVVVACLEWLEKGWGASLAGGPPPWFGKQLELRKAVPIVSSALPGADPYTTFSQAAQQALSHASEEAERRDSWIGTQHLLLGLHAVEESRAGQALRELAVDPAALQVDEAPEPGAKGLPTNRLRKVLKWAKREAGRDSARLVGTDHLLLGLLLEGESHVAQALDGSGVSYRHVREVIERLTPEA
jgi:Clp amino terminal domain, pathogenicity island component